MHVDWQGVFPAATTQFKADQSLDLAATLAHVDAMIEAGIDGLIMLGTVGENCSLEAGEKREVLQATVDARRRAGCPCSRASPSTRRRSPAGSRGTPRRSASTA